MASPGEGESSGDGGRPHSLVKRAFLGFIGLGLLIVFLAWKNFDVSVLRGFQRWDYLALAIVLAALYPLFLGFRTQVLLASLGQRIPLREAAQASYAERFLSTVLPLRLNIPMKGFLLARLSNVSITQGVSVSVHEFALDTGFVFAISLIGIPVLWSRHPLLAWLLVAASSLCVALVSLPSSFLNRVFPRRGRLAGAVIRLLDGLHNSWSHLLHSPGLLARLLAIFGVLQILGVVIYWLLFGALGLRLDLGGSLGLLVAFSASTLLGGLSLVPGGLGVRELTMVGVLSQWGVPSTATVLVSLSGRLIYLVVEVIGYLLSFQMGGEAFRDLLRKLKQEMSRTRTAGPEAGPPRPPSPKG